MLNLGILLFVKRFTMSHKVEIKMSDLVTGSLHDYIYVKYLFCV